VTGRIVIFTHSSRRTQFDNMFLLLRILSEYEAAHAVSFPSILIVRKDLAFKQSLRPFLLDTRLYSNDGGVEHGVAFAWREINGEWRLFSTQRVSKETLARNKRTPDTLHLVSRSFLPMWRMVVANRSNWNALHEVLTSRARSLLEPRESIVRYSCAVRSTPTRTGSSPVPTRSTTFCRKKATSFFEHNRRRLALTPPTGGKRRRASARRGPTLPRTRRLAGRAARPPRIAARLRWATARARRRSSMTIQAHTPRCWPTTEAGAPSCASRQTAGNLAVR